MASLPFMKNLLLSGDVSAATIEQLYNQSLGISTGLKQMPIPKHFPS
jgi:hypothetical protein